MSNWELGRNKINVDDRLVLVSIISILHRFGGISTAEEADAFLHSGNYRGLNSDERQQIFASSAEATTEPVQAPSAEPEMDIALSLERSRELILLARVERSWITGVLEDADYQFAEIPLTAHSVPAAVSHVWPEMTPPPTNPEQFALDETTLVRLFAASDASLLILGGAGAGKTFTMLRLVRGLLKRAVADPRQPIPVVLSLSSWAERRRPVSDWLVDELATKYHIPRPIGRTWLQEDRIALFLDGLDVLPPPLIAPCLQAINQFRQEFGFIGVVVASRTAAYFDADALLDCGLALELDPVPTEEAGRFLAQQDPEQIDSGRTFILDPALVDLVHSPLALKIITSLTQGDPASPVSVNDVSATDEETYLKSLIGRYVEEILAHPFGATQYPASDLRRWLAWLAGRMKEHNQTELLVENVQPSWLPSDPWRWFYMLLTRLVDGLIIGLIMWLLLHHLHLVHPGLPLGLTRPFERADGISSGAQDLFWLLGVNALLGILVAFVQMFLYEHNPLATHFQLTPWQRRHGQILIVGIVVFVVAYLTSFQLGEPIPMLFWALIEAIIFMLFGRFIHGYRYRAEVRHTIALNWSWRRVKMGLVASALLAALIELIEFSYHVDNGIWKTFLAYTVVGVLLGGLSGERMATSVRPNEGMVRAYRNARTATMVALPVMAVLSLLLWGTKELLFTILLVLTCTATFYGGSKVGNHLLLRMIFRYKKLVPHHLIRMLNQATAVSILRRVGSGYIFSHQLIQDYFAELSQE
ncbi:MAG: hypothetical protein KDE28_14060 [Anaerolineales bacterium]|nr:hypothetical protein [Anaerolineales bacterium]